MLHASLDKIDEVFLRQLCVDGVAESGTLDFKRELPAPGDAGRVEFLKDASALANCEGGDLIYGVDERDGCAATLMPVVGLPVDDAKRRFSQMLDTLEPRIQGIRMHAVETDGGFVLIVRVPASFDGPHSIKINGTNRRFVMRNGTTTSDMSYEQLRFAFDRTASLVARADDAIEQRVGAIVNKRARRLLEDGAICSINFVLLGGLAGRMPIDIPLVNSGNGWLQLLDPTWGGGSNSMNLDGLLVFPGGSAQEPKWGYTQLYRDGGLECVSLVGHSVPGQGADRKLVFSTDLAKFCRRSVDVFIKLAKTYDLTGPALLNVSLLHVDGYELGLAQAWHRFNRAFTDRPHLVLPNVLIPNIETATVDAVVKPQLDLLWQAFDVSGCTEYDKTGNWAPRA